MQILKPKAAKPRNDPPWASLPATVTVELTRDDLVRLFDLSYTGEAGPCHPVDGRFHEVLAKRFGERVLQDSRKRLQRGKLV